MDTSVLCVSLTLFEITVLKVFRGYLIEECRFSEISTSTDYYHDRHSTAPSELGGFGDSYTPAGLINFAGRS